MTAGGRVGAGPPLVLVLNAGSSTLKAAVVEDDDNSRLVRPPRASSLVDWGNDASRSANVVAGVAGVLEAVERAGVSLDRLAAVAHRVVHGGPAFRAPVVIDETVLATIDSLAPLAPLHNPVAAATIRAARGLVGGILHVAVFDTAFHASLPESTWRYPLPTAWEDWGIRRYGFHGLSVAWSVERAAVLLGRPVEELQMVVAHLGSGCSVTAVAEGRSVATSMGMTPLEGLMMGTRAGSVDPGILLAILRDGRRTVAQLTEELDHAAGLLGVSGRSAGLRELEGAAAGGDQRAALAIEMFVERAAAGIAAAATALRGIDAIVFTGGIGEHAARTRAQIVERLAVLGVAPVAATETGDDRVLTGMGEVPAVLRVEAREDIVAARAALAVGGR